MAGSNFRRGTFRRVAAQQLRPLLLVVLALVIGSASSCGADFDPAFDIQTLRIVGVGADKPYPAPGDNLALSLTFSDSIDEGPRPVQVTWIAGCVDPQGGSYLACFAQLGPQFAALATGQPPADGSVKQEVLDPSASGVVGGATFAFDIPADVLATGQTNDDGVKVSTVVTFFAVCAGELKPLLGEEGDNNALPLGCFDENNNRLSARDFVFGYTQQYVFGDVRPNDNPPVGGLTLADVALSETATDNAVVACPDVAEEGCGQAESSCTSYDLKVLVDDVAEVDPDARDDEGNVLREVLWVDYYSEGGSFDGERKLISDPITGYTPEFNSEWTPPAEAGEVRIWAVVHDNRGGISVVSGVVQVQ